jgi:predicted PurR-regulated permease PerM
MWYRKKFFKIATAIILILLIIHLMMQLSPIFDLIFSFIETILFPVLFAGVLYYILRPLCYFLEKKKIPRIVSILVIYFILILCFSFVIIFVWPYISEQITEFTSTPTEKIKQMENKTVDLMNLFNFTSLTHEQLRQNLGYYFEKIVNLISSNLIFTLSSIAKITSYFFFTPFILFYLLKDDHKMFRSIMKKIPETYEARGKKLLNDIDYILSSYITSQLIVAAIVASLIFIGYMIIGLNYVVLLSLITFFFNLIPFGGPIISTIPAVLIALTQSPLMALKVLIVIMVVHLLDMNLISPRVVGPRLQIHPITIILLLIASLSIFGMIGLFLIIPLYAILKVIISDLYNSNLKEPELSSSKVK